MLLNCFLALGLGFNKIFVFNLDELDTAGRHKFNIQFNIDLFLNLFIHQPVHTSTYLYCLGNMKHVDGSSFSGAIWVWKWKFLYRYGRFPEFLFSNPQLVDVRKGVQSPKLAPILMNRQLPYGDWSTGPLVAELTHIKCHQRLVVCPGVMNVHSCFIIAWTKADIFKINGDDDSLFYANVPIKTITHWLITYTVRQSDASRKRLAHIVNAVLCTNILF